MTRPLEKFFSSSSRVENVKRRAWAVGEAPAPKDTPSTDFEGDNILALRLVRCEKSVWISKKGWELHFLRNR